MAIALFFYRSLNRSPALRCSPIGRTPASIAQYATATHTVMGVGVGSYLQLYCTPFGREHVLNLPRSGNMHRTSSFQTDVLCSWWKKLNSYYVHPRLHRGVPLVTASHDANLRCYSHRLAYFRAQRPLLQLQLHPEGDTRENLSLGPERLGQNVGLRAVVPCHPNEHQRTRDGPTCCTHIQQKYRMPIFGTAMQLLQEDWIW